MKSILISGAYSPKNIGDGLLAEISVQLAYEATQSAVYLSALDPKGFRNELIDNPERYPGLKAENIFSSLNLFRLVRILFRQDFVVLAVGGEYLNFTGVKSSIKSLVANGLALLVASFLRIPIGFLPQGIIVSKKMRPFVLPLLARAKWILLRDDKSMLELEGLNNISKSFDLAILDIEIEDTEVFHPKIIGSILHNISNSEDYIESVRSIAKFPKMKFFVQSDIGGSNMDSEFLVKRLKVKVFQSASHLYKSNSDVGVLISTRLHGAVGAIRSGIPSLHIAYSRKGKAVFGDLGIPDFCVNYEDLESDDLINMANELNTSKEARQKYWEKVNSSSRKRTYERKRILSLIRSLSDEC
jgi:polysaccharide pyruvyl transferase WcaK-like protein